MSKVDPELISLEKINLLASTIFQNEFEEAEASEFKLTFSFRPGVNIEQKLVRLIFGCSIESIKDEVIDHSKHANFTIGYTFKVENLASLASTDSAISISKSLMVALANIAFSTSRGIIHARCQGTPFNRIILPVMTNAKMTELVAPEVHE